MARTTIEAERILPYAPGDLCRLVGDVRIYPEFVPFLQTMRVLKEEPLPEGGWRGVAEADVGWQAIKVRFSTSVRCEPEKGEVEVGRLGKLEDTHGDGATVDADAPPLREVVARGLRLPSEDDDVEEVGLVAPLAVLVA